MATLIGKESSALDMLINLIELDHDAIEAYEVAARKISDPISREALESFRGDHERHVTDLGAVVEQLGAEPPQKGDLKRLLTQGKVYLGSMMGDKAILAAMKSNEDDTNAAYERAVSRADLPYEVVELLRRNLTDERRHRDWIIARLQMLEAAESAGAQP